MGKHEGRRLDRRTAERLLGGTSAGAPRALAGLLAAAAAPPHDGELTGERAATAAFTAATRHMHVPRQRSPTVKGVIAKFLTVKVAAGVAVVAIGGVATAAATGHLVRSDLGPPVTVSTSTHSTASGETSITQTRDATDPALAHGGSPSASLVGLCHAYSAGGSANHGKDLGSPAFSSLVDAAGGAAKVDAYCDTLLTEAASGGSGNGNSTAQTDAQGAQDTGAQGNGATKGNGDQGNSAAAPGQQTTVTHGNSGQTHTTGPPATHAPAEATTDPGKG